MIMMMSVNGTKIYISTIDNSTIIIAGEWYNRYDLGCNTTCSLNGINFANGDYHWWIRGWSSTSGYGAWTSLNFSVDVPIPTISNMYIGDNNTSLNYDYDDVSEWYEIYVSTIDNSVIPVNQWYSASDLNCSDTCSLSGFKPCQWGLPMVDTWMESY